MDKVRTPKAILVWGINLRLYKLLGARGKPSTFFYRAQWLVEPFPSPVSLLFRDNIPDVQTHSCGDTASDSVKNLEIPKKDPPGHAKSLEKKSKKIKIF